MSGICFHSYHGKGGSSKTQNICKNIQVNKPLYIYGLYLPGTECYYQGISLAGIINSILIYITS